ncbi:hypothetical protein [Flexivirga sp.]|uniref:hypothetical protein n=1 Tax=Flexivirga sp. TaxID=1962927 RepID=UPI003F7EC049
MTLVLTFMSDDFALMVGDTRLCTRDASGSYEPISEDAVKLEHVGGLLVCFAGLAAFARIPTIEWLNKRFARPAPDMDSALSALARELDGRFERRQHRGLTLTVTIAGWVLDDSDALTAIVASVTNQHPKTFERLDAFKHAWKRLPAAGGWVPTGQIDLAREAQLAIALKDALRREATPAVIANLFLATLRDEAGQNITVGPSARIATLPRSILSATRSQGHGDYTVWRARQPAMVAEVPMEIEVSPDMLELELFPLEKLDLSRANIVH